MKPTDSCSVNHESVAAPCLPNWSPVHNFGLFQAWFAPNSQDQENKKQAYRQVYYESSALSALSLAMCRRFSYIILCNPKQKGKKKTPKQNSLKKVSLARQSVGGKKRGRDRCKAVSI